MVGASIISYQLARPSQIRMVKLVKEIDRIQMCVIISKQLKGEIN